MRSIIVKRDAITLMELLIVIAISAVIYATVLIGISSIDKKRLEVAVRNIVSDLILARQLAASQHNNYIIVFDTAGEKYTVYRGSVVSTNKTQEKTLDVDLVSVTDWAGTPQTNLQFYSHTGLTDNRLINVTFAGKSKLINVTALTGYVKMQ